MNHARTTTRSRAGLAAVPALAASLLLTGTATLAGPGAHGPNGEHLDAPPALAAGPALPQVTAASDLFELVAQLKAGELVITLDRFATNEPVTAARIELEAGALRTVALYRPETQDYRVVEPALVQALRQPGEHALVFTVQAGDEADLLDGVLAVAAEGAPAPTAQVHDHDDDHGHSHTLERLLIAAGGLAAVGLVGGLTYRRRRSATTPAGGPL